MKLRIILLLLMLGLLLSGAVNGKAISLEIDGSTSDVSVSLYNATSYVPLRAVTKLLTPNAQISWKNRQAVVTSNTLYLTARPGDHYLNANGRMLYIKDGVRLINGSTWIPIRVLVKAMGGTTSWNNHTQTVSVTRGHGTILSGDQYYDSASVYWLSRIIHAESTGEPLNGKIAVGNVILNRVKSPEYPYSIYHVIFDETYGVQFEPVRNGTIYDMPDEESILAAKLCLDGASVVGNSLYFLNPDKSSSRWAIQNCTFVATIGQHQFYA